MNNFKSKGLRCYFFTEKISRILKLPLWALILTLCLTLDSKACAQEIPLSLYMENVTIKEILKEIEEKSNYTFFYNDKVVNTNRKTNIRAVNKPLGAILSEILPECIWQVDNGKIILIPGSQESRVPAVSQDRRITGIVTDMNGEPLAGVNIRVKGASMGVISDIDGKFDLSVAPGAVLVASYVGFNTREITVGNQTTLAIRLSEDSRTLEEVVVVGYGVQKKKLITGATVQVSGENIQKINRVDVLGAMQGQTPGVNIVQRSGMPGDVFSVSIRGLGTTGNAEPLYVIDGVPEGHINNLSSSDIESIDVLKDAATAAIYGARAANGVILITTKQGKAGKPQISYDAYYGVQDIYKMVTPLNAREYMSIQNEVRFNDGNPPLDFAALAPKQYDAVMNGGWDGTQWLEAIRNKNAPVQSHSVGLTGGTELSKYALGFSYLTQEGILGEPAPPTFTRYTARINSDYVVLKGDGFDILKIGENINYNYKETSMINLLNIYNNDIRNMLIASPLMPIYDESGGYYDHSSRQADRWILDNEAFNPVAEMVYKRGNLTKNHGLQANVFIEIQPLRDLKFKSSYNYMFDSNTNREYIPIYNLGNRRLRTEEYIFQGANSGYSWTWENTLSYMLRLKQHTIDAVIGQSIEKRGYGEAMGGNNSQSLFPGSFDHAWLNNAKNRDTNYMGVYGGPLTRENLASFFGRLIYNLKETYLASVSLRADGSSNFARGKRWGYFPTASAGWIISNEPFMEFSKGILDFFKVRASWGQNGNYKITPFQYLATIAFDADYGFGADDNARHTGAYGDIIPNPDIKWETSEQINVGFDSRWLSSRLGMTFDWYAKTTKDWLVLAPMLASYGTNPPYINGGNVENKGIELLLSWTDRIGDFSYGINWNMAKNRNKITKIANSQGIIYGQSSILSEGVSEFYRAQVGYPIGYFIGYKTAGIFQNQEQINNTPVKRDDAQPGDVIFVDMNQDGLINLDDRTMIGNPHPDITSGLNLNFGYKGFDLSLNAYGAFGHQIIRSYRDFRYYSLQNYTTDIFERWHGEGTSNKLPRLTTGTHFNWSVSDIFIEDADYMKIQSITIGYDFKRLFPRLPMVQARLYVSAQNLFTFTGYSGMDPEVGYNQREYDRETLYGDTWTSGIDSGFYPSPRVYMVGLNLKF
ncbi:MAG: TonB-dependent receptor [Tannerellaceae bacterium]|jgi:TonB-linked SusC/RagA family outer membrane protein|nr:TonB-dependent receptor [Tannerellaceae bacterium]